MFALSWLSASSCNASTMSDPSSFTSKIFEVGLYLSSSLFLSDSSSWKTSLTGWPSHSILNSFSWVIHNCSSAYSLISIRFYMSSLNTKVSELESYYKEFPLANGYQSKLFSCGFPSLNLIFEGQHRGHRNHGFQKIIVQGFSLA